MHNLLISLGFKRKAEFFQKEEFTEENLKKCYGTPVYGYYKYKFKKFIPELQKGRKCIGYSILFIAFYKASKMWQVYIPNDKRIEIIINYLRSGYSINFVGHVYGNDYVEFFSHNAAVESIFKIKDEISSCNLFSAAKSLMTSMFFNTSFSAYIFTGNMHCSCLVKDNDKLYYFCPDNGIYSIDYYKFTPISIRIFFNNIMSTSMRTQVITGFKNEILAILNGENDKIKKMLEYLYIGNNQSKNIGEVIYLKQISNIEKMLEYLYIENNQSKNIGEAIYLEQINKTKLGNPGFAEHVTKDFFLGKSYHHSKIRMRHPIYLKNKYGDNTIQPTNFE